MAITNNGTENNLPASQIPSGYTRPTVTTFTDFTWRRKDILSILKVTVDNTDKDVTMTNIIEDGTIGIEKQITDILANDYIASNTVEAFSRLTDLSSTTDPTDASSEFLSDVADSYTATVETFVKVS